MIVTILRRTGVLVLLACVLALLPTASAQQTLPPYNRDEKPGAPPPVPGPDEPEVQGRGPLHEGFAQPSGPPGAGATAPKAPPEPIPELPPQQRPEGDNVVWVPGYWAWDADKKDFLWVSGFWRVPPTGRKWTPGYWAKTDNGYRWVTGYWAPANRNQMPYAPEAPPDSLDLGPSVAPPSDDYFYVPGNWVYQDSRFLWSPGFWTPWQPGFVWCPPRWSWTPRGFLFVGGFWDRPLAKRGVLFAPVHFSKPLWQKQGWAFTPTHVVPTQALVGSLWVRPSAGTYAYGDYYGAKYARAGYQPWATYGSKVHDPLFSYYRGANVDNPRWQRNLVATHQDRVNGNATLPPRTLAAQQRLRSPSADLVMAQPLSSFKGDSARLKQVTQTERSTFQRSLESSRKVTTERRTLEAEALRRNERVLSSGNRLPASHEVQKPLVQTPSQRQAIQSQSSQRQFEAQRLHTTNTPQLRSVQPLNNYSAPRIQTAPRVYSAPVAPQRQQVIQSYHAAPQMRAPVHHSAPAHHGGGGRRGR